jgi:Flp pilus assembly protein TadD
MSNLANLYQALGHADLAAEYLERVNTHRKRNPYYRFQLANEAFINGDYDTAIEHIRYAIRLRDDEPRFYSLLSFSYMMSGDRDAARRWMKKAEAVAEQEADKERYHHKLDLLMGEDAGR